MTRFCEKHEVQKGGRFRSRGPPWKTHGFA